MSENVKAFCSLPLKYRLFPKVVRKDHKVEGEARAAKQRWTAADIANHPGESFADRASRLEGENWRREPYQRDGKVDFTSIRVTQLNFNKLVYMPEASSWANEVIINHQQLETLQVLDEYILNECDEFGNPFGHENLTKQEALGRKEIIRGIKNKNWMLYGTDKSEKLVLDTRENFLLAMAPQIRDHIEVSLNQVHESEKVLNNYSKGLCRAINIGMNAGRNQQLRISQATQVHSSSVPQAKGVRKDHKENDPIFGPPIRMLMDGKKGPNAPLANITSRVLRPVRQNLNEKIQTEAISTEEICHHFIAHNQKS